MRFRGTTYRAHHPRWAFRPDSGEGAALHGGRFNPPGRPTLYASLRVETAWLEAQQAFPFKAQPMTICAYEVDCEDMADLTDDDVLASLAIAREDLSCAWEDQSGLGMTPPSWRIADRLIASGAAGMLVNSFAPGAGPGDVNAIFWSWEAEPPHRVRTIDDHGRLPLNDLSWRQPPS